MYESKRTALLPKCKECGEPLDSKKNSYQIQLVNTEEKISSQQSESDELFSLRKMFFDTYKIDCNKCQKSYEEIKERFEELGVFAQCKKCNSFNTKFEYIPLKQWYEKTNKDGISPNRRSPDSKNNPIISDAAPKCKCLDCGEIWILENSNKKFIQNNHNFPDLTTSLSPLGRPSYV